MTFLIDIGLCEHAELWCVIVYMCRVTIMLSDHIILFRFCSSIFKSLGLFYVIVCEIRLLTVVSQV